MSQRLEDCVELACPHCGGPIVLHRSRDFRSTIRRFRCGACGRASRLPLRARAASIGALTVIVVVIVGFAWLLGLRETETPGGALLAVGLLVGMMLVVPPMTAGFCRRYTDRLVK